MCAQTQLSGNWQPVAGVATRVATPFEVVATFRLPPPWWILFVFAVSECDFFEKLLADPLDVVSAVVFYTYTSQFGRFDERLVHQAGRF